MVYRLAALLFLLCGAGSWLPAPVQAAAPFRVEQVPDSSPSYFCPVPKMRVRVTAYGDQIWRVSQRRRDISAQCEPQPAPYTSVMIVPSSEAPVAAEVQEARAGEQGSGPRFVVQVSSRGRSTVCTIEAPAAGETGCFGGGLELVPPPPSRRRAPQTARAQVGNTHFVTPSLCHSAGFWALAVGERSGAEAQYSVSWRTLRGGRAVEFEILDGGADVYVGLAGSRRDALRLFWGLTGAPQLPPVWALGFMASRWGWRSRDEVSQVLDEFDLRQLPIDAFIMDFEWYLNGTGDYNLPPAGRPEFPDFGLGNAQTMPDPAGQRAEYRARNVRMGGIRKPRLGDSARLAAARAQGWILSPYTRDLDFGQAPAREMYARGLEALLREAGSLPDFWWNDEGETAYFTYHAWIQAEQAVQAPAVAASSPRRFSLSRAFTPGMQRLEAAAVWTGDVPISWNSLRAHVGMLVRWSEAGLALASMDIGGFYGPEDPSGELLARWYQLGVFAGVMRVHSTLQRQPHFPFPAMYGPGPAAAMRAALQLRYALVPALYSSLHAARAAGLPWLERVEGDACPDLGCFFVADKALLVVPVVEPAAAPNASLPRRRDFPLPPAARAWFPFIQGGPALSGVVDLAAFSARLELFPIFARAGSIVLLGDFKQLRASELVGARGRLSVLVYVGAACQTRLVQDDGGLRVQSAPTQVSRFTWDDAARYFSVLTTGATDQPWYVVADVLVHELDGAVSKFEIPLRPAQEAGWRVGFPREDSPPPGEEGRPPVQSALLQSPAHEKGWAAEVFRL